MRLWLHVRFLMTYRLSVATLLFLPLIAMAALQHEVSSKILMAKIRAHGALKVLNEQVLADAATWKAVHKGISSGEEGWIDVAAALRPVADAGVSESFDIALFFALKQAPSKVLAMLVQQNSSGSDFVCSGMGGVVFDVNDLTTQQALAWIDERIIAVQNVDNPTLATVRASCLNNLVKLKKIVTEMKLE